MGFGADGSSFAVIGNGVAFGFGEGIFELGKEGGSVEVVGFLEAGKVTEGGEEVDGFDNGGADIAGLPDFGCDDDEGRAKGFFEEGMLAPDGVFAEVPAMITPDNDDGVFGKIEVVELFDDASDLGVRISHASGVVLANLEREGGVSVGVFSPAVILHELTGTVPGGLAFRLFRVGSFGKLGVFVGLEVFRGSTEGEMRTKDSGGEEEGFFVSGNEVELLQGFVNGDAVRINFVTSFEGLKEIHVFGVLADLAIGESVHPAAWVLPLAGGEEVAVPGFGHFDFGVVVPIRSAASAGVVGNFSDGDGGVTVLAEVGRKRRVLDVFGTCEKGTISAGAILAGEESIAGSSTGWGLDIVTGKDAAFRGEGIDVG